MRKRDDRNVPYLALLAEKRGGGALQIHAGLARHGVGHTLCTDRQLFEFWLPARDPRFALHHKDGWRHRYAEAFLELNAGCRDCLNILYGISREAGWTTPKSIAV